MEAETNRLKLIADANNDNTSKLGDFKHDPASETATDWLHEAVVSVSQFDVQGVFLVLN